MLYLLVDWLLIYLGMETFFVVYEIGYQYNQRGQLRASCVNNLSIFLNNFFTDLGEYTKDMKYSKKCVSWTQTCIACVSTGSFDNNIL